MTDCLLLSGLSDWDHDNTLDGTLTPSDESMELEAKGHDLQANLLGSRSMSMVPSPRGKGAMSGAQDESDLSEVSSLGEEASLEDPIANFSKVGGTGTEVLMGGLTLSVPWAPYGITLLLVLTFLAQKGFIRIWIISTKCISERLTGAKSSFDW